MNYYIQGDAANADKIKAAFEKLGFDVTGFDMRNDNILFFTYRLQTGANVISTTNAHLFTANIIKTHPDYKELELSVEPKFKVGDWVVKKDGTPFYGGNYAEQITNIEDDGGLKCIWFSSGTWLRDKDIRLWTIQDAKDGDVLVNDAGCIFINAGFEKDDKVTLACYCYVSVQGIFYEEDYKTGSWLYTSHIHPATKEQRDLLFNKMKEAGYEWDADKKELRKIKPHYDISNFHAGMPVLVRDYVYEEWRYVQFSHIREIAHALVFDAGCQDWYQCIPFNEDTKHLLGTTDMPDEMYINW